MLKKYSGSLQKIILLLLVSTFSAGLIAGCSSNNKPAAAKIQDSQKKVVRKTLQVKKKMPAGNNIWMKNLAFVPKIKVIKVGTTVTWTNKDVAMHTVQSGTPAKPLTAISSGTLGKGQVFSYTFKKKGTFKYFCTTHPSIMQATVVVQ